MKALILATDKRAFLKLCDIPLVKRLLYTLRVADVREVIILVANDDANVQKATGNGKKLGMRVDFLRADDSTFPVEKLAQKLQGRFVLIEGNYVLDERLLRKLTEIEGTVLCYDSNAKHIPGLRVLVEDGEVKAIGEHLTESSGSYVGVTLCTEEVFLTVKDLSNKNYNYHQWLAHLIRHSRVLPLDVTRIVPYTADVRRKLDIFWFKIDTEEDISACREMLLQRSQKRTLDVLAWNFNRPLENWTVRRIAHLPITPNQMSIITSIVAYGITFLFFRGYLLPASLLTFVVNVLDGVDGKLARVKGIITKLGHLEHSFDLLYEQSWYIAFAWALSSKVGTLLPLALGFAMVLFDSFARHCSMQFKEVMGVPLADYAPFDRRFRRFDGRRNIYTIYILIGVVTGFPLYALFAMALHAFLTATVYAFRAFKHLRGADLGVTASEE